MHVPTFTAEDAERAEDRRGKNRRATVASEFASDVGVSGNDRRDPRVLLEILARFA